MGDKDRVTGVNYGLPPDVDQTFVVDQWDVAGSVAGPACVTFLSSRRNTGTGMSFGGSVYWLTYGIANDGHFAVYHDRLKKAVAAIAEGKVWNEPTSFCLFRSKLAIDDVAGCLAKVIRNDRDFVLIGMPYRQEGRVLGNWGDDRLLQLMPFAQFV